MHLKNAWFFFFLTAAFSVFGQTNSIEVDADGNVRIDTPNLIVNGVEYSVIPVGAIIMWSGPAVPDGWALCDGASYQGVNSEVIKTPNLSGRFIVGYAPEDGDGTPDYHKIGNAGGLTTVTLTATQMPSHGHSMDYSGSHYHQVTAYDDHYSHSGVARESNMKRPYDDYHGEFPVYTSTDGSHIHTINAAGGNAPHENRPPYYVLAYIMKIKGKGPEMALPR